MKKIIFLTAIIAIIFLGCDKDEQPLIQASSEELVGSEPNEKPTLQSSDYGIYGEVLWPVSGTAYNAVEGPTVLIYKWVNNVWTYHGSTGASACGYYTYETGERGTFRALISGYYYMRTYPDCLTRTDNNMHEGSGDGVVSIWVPWVVVNVRCS